MDDPMSDIDPYYSEDSLEEGQTDSSSNDMNNTLIYPRVISPAVDLVCAPITSESKALYDVVAAHLDKTVVELEKRNFGEARGHCLKAFNLLTCVTEPSSEALMNYNTCCTIFQQCGDHESALECFYQAFWLRKLEFYPVHVSEVLIYWIPILEQLSHVKLVTLIRKLKTNTDKKFEESPAENSMKALLIYLDLNRTLFGLSQNVQLRRAIVDDERAVLLQIAKCFLWSKQYKEVCRLCKDIENKFPGGTGAMIREYLMTWAEALFNMGKFDVARKKAEQAQGLSWKKEEKSAVQKLLSLIDSRLVAEDEEDNERIDSDNEYVQDSNYVHLEQMKARRQEAEERHHKRSPRHRPKRNPKSQENDYMWETKWQDVQKKRKARKRNLTTSSVGSQTPSDTSEMPLPEAHTDSDIDDDPDIDRMSTRTEAYYSGDSASEDDTNIEDYANVDQFERCASMFAQGTDDQFDEQDVLQNGVELSDYFIDGLKRAGGFSYPELYSKEKNEDLCRKNPEKFKRCKIRIESSHGAVCTNLDHSDDVQEIEISGRSKIGKVFNGDEVYVEILSNERDAYKNKNFIPRLQKTLDLTKMSLKIYGQVRGVIRRHQYQDVDHPVFVCVLDEQEYHLMLPISKTVPKLHILNRNCKDKYQIDVYRYDEAKSELKHKELFNIKPGEVKNYIFLVAMICWDSLYPLGAVIKVINAKDGLNSGMEILRLHHQVPTGYKFETVECVNRMLQTKDKPKKKGAVREDLTGLEVFTIDPPNSRDLDDALSIEEISDGNLRIGIHIADVTALVQKGDAVDIEAYDRATSFYPGQGRNPYHMLPEPLSTNLCSLVPGEARPAISIFFVCDKEGKTIEAPSFKKSTIKSHKKLSYRDAQDVILGLDTANIPASICKQINTLFKIAQKRRIKRLGGGMYHVPIETNDDDDDFNETKEAHYLVEEFMIWANHTVGTFLFRKFKDQGCVPLRIQGPPEPELVQQWLSAHQYSADLILKLQEIHPLPAIDNERKLSIETAPTGRYNRVLMFQNFVWHNFVQAIKKKDIVKAMKILGCDESHPFSCLGLEEWYQIQETAEYKCSGEVKNKKEGMHFTLGIFPYIHFSSPIRRYVDIISHRLLHCALDGIEPCYTKEEVSEMCMYINDVTSRARAYQKKCRALTWGYKLRNESKVFHGFVRNVSEKDVTVIVPGHRKLPKESTTLQLNCLGAVKKPLIKSDTRTKREILELQWKKRLYSYNGYAPIKVVREETNVLRLNPHNRGFFQQQHKWKQCLQVLVGERPVDEKLRQLKIIINHTDLGHAETNLEDSEPACFRVNKDVSSEVRQGNITLQSCDYSLTFNHGQILALQMSAESVKGALIPQIELVDVTKNVKHCLLHVKDPVKHLEKYSTCPTKDSYCRPVDYIKTWKPLVEMEAATNAADGDIATINDVPVKFLSQKEGKFSLRKAFLEQRNLEINKVPLEVYLNGHSEEEEDEDGIKIIASPDYLCIKTVLYMSEEQKPGMQFGNTNDCDPSEYRIWNGHAKIDRVKVKGEKGKIDFIFKLHRDSKPVPNEFLREKVKPRCSIEILFKRSADGRIDALLQCLDKASPLAKAIAVGTKIPKLDKGHFEIGRKIQPDLMDFPDIVRNNPKQLVAIQKALVSAFSLIQGPPGTGKTYTGMKLIYLFNQMNLKWKELGNEKKQIIFCGPSNKSVDLVAKWMKRKLKDHCPKMVRWYGRSIEDQEYPIPGKTPSLGQGERAKADEELREYSMHILIRQLGKPYAEDITSFDRKFRQNPDGIDFKDVNTYKKLVRKAVIEEVAHYDVIFCTTTMATNLRIMEGTKGRIFQIIIDEAGMCTEPESMAAIIASKAEQVVLIGDHKQLRPIVMCSEAAKLGLEKSLFERYAAKATMLTSQYRMNPEICAFPSKQFYNNRLETMPSKTWQTKTPLKSWLKNSVPVIFCHVEGNEEYLPFNTDEGNEQSCSNKEEVDQVVKVFKHLVEEEVIDPHYINVMSQYNSQCHAIRAALKKDKFIQFNVNTVVASQGGEWDYVIISLVRSLPDYRIEPKPTLGWCKQNLGFITDENQTNVALTRARKGLIVIGNQRLLKCNEVWANFLDHYAKKGCVVDSDKYPPPPQRIVERKQKKKSRRVQAMDEDFYRGTDQDPNLNGAENRTE